MSKVKYTYSEILYVSASMPLRMYMRLGHTLVMGQQSFVRRHFDKAQITSKPIDLLCSLLMLLSRQMSLHHIISVGIGITWAAIILTIHLKNEIDARNSDDICCGHMHKHANKC